MTITIHYLSYQGAPTAGTRSPLVLRTRGPVHIDTREGLLFFTKDREIATYYLSPNVGVPCCAVDIEAEP